MLDGPILVAGNQFGKTLGKTHIIILIKGNVIIKNSKNCYVRSEDRLVATLGLKNVIVVETNDAI